MENKTKFNVSSAIECTRRMISVAASGREKDHRNNRGFTMIELLIIMVIVGILVIIAIPTFTYLWNRSKEYRCMEEIRILEKEIDAYLINNGALPADLGVINRDKLRDPWGNLYNYYIIPTDYSGAYVDASGGNPLNPNPNDFDLYSKGKDGSSDLKLAADNTADDIIRGGSGAYVGRGEQY